jgi:hypothetical protein
MNMPHCLLSNKKTAGLYHLSLSSYSKNNQLHYILKLTEELGHRRDRLRKGAQKLTLYQVSHIDEKSWNSENLL